ncbi:GNAT family N-acetyltransferase [Vibrio sagamiensis]|uniref:Protein ElaA n=1 Tax=Vibrio sagamiensis NBRC 104589 TaxID=1219064 RepID=A0A511QKM8_9VIBR|nr:GNAT family N-acetyltransferase [Vibrio sagamiensis]PNQ70783.1 GNAT family N-acetyltransferase [Vibrio agarivorans]GEM77022.1 ElaA protein [Vibrio sagamiensis NBRC 104589]
MLNWVLLPFSQLTNQQLYEMLRLRVDVFVVEQTCPYPELDGKDTIEGVQHLLGYQDEQLVACTRLLPSGVSFESVSIGRVATKLSARKQGLGHQLLQQALTHCQILWPDQSIEIGAQKHLVDFYAQHGFEVSSDVYLEDGILHVNMRRGS